MVSILVAGLGAPETPRIRPTDKSWLFVEMAAGRGCVSRLRVDGTVEVVATTGKPNGLTVDRDGYVWVANCEPVPALLRVTPDGIVETVLTAAEGRPLLLPNDLCFGPDGMLYMTDSGMLMSEWVPDGDIRADYAHASFDGRVYRVDPASGEASILDDGIRFTNGLAFGPEGDLYVNEMISGDVFRYSFADAAPTGERSLFANVMSAHWTTGFRGPDGMNFGADGRLYCTVFGEGNVAVLDGHGRVQDRIPTEGRRPTNLAWGPDGDSRIFVTEIELGRIEIHDTATTALPLYYGGPERIAL